MTRSEDISRRLKLRQLRVFLVVARTGSMAKAAKHLATSQSVVSKTVAELENILGVRLVDRTAQGIEPTLYGRTLLKRSIAFFDDLRASVGEIEFLADPTVGELRIGTTEPQAGIVVRTIERLSRRYSRVNFKVVLGSGQMLIDRELRERQIDLVIAPSPPRSDDDLETTFLYCNHLRVVASMKSPWARRRKINLQELVNERWCTPPVDSAGASQFVSALRACGLPLPRIVVACAANHLCHGILADGCFLGISSDGYLHFDLQPLPLKVLPVDLPAQPVEISIVLLKNRTITPVAQLFIDCACEVVKPLTQKTVKPGTNSK
jgi:DNA-binding transcriptional LysR family regulator